MDVQDLREQALGAGTRTSAAAARNRALEGCLLYTSDAADD